MHSGYSTRGGPMRYLELIFVGSVALGCGSDESSELVLDAGTSWETDAAEADAAREPCSANVDLLDYKFAPAELTLESGRITLCARNGGKAPHDVALRDADHRELARTA